MWKFLYPDGLEQSAAIIEVFVLLALDIIMLLYMLIFNCIYLQIFLKLLFA